MPKNKKKADSSSSDSDDGPVDVSRIFCLIIPIYNHVI